MLNPEVVKYLQEDPYHRSHNCGVGCIGAAEANILRARQAQKAEMEQLRRQNMELQKQLAERQ